MLEHETGADMRLVRQISKGMKIQAGGEHRGCSKESQENQVICLQCQEEVVRVCPGSPRSPRRAIATRLSSGSAGKGTLCTTWDLSYVITCVVDSISCSVYVANYPNFTTECE